MASVYNKYVCTTQSEQSSTDKLAIIKSNFIVKFYSVGRNNNSVVKWLCFELYIIKIILGWKDCRNLCEYGKSQLTLGSAYPYIATAFLHG